MVPTDPDTGEDVLEDACFIATLTPEEARTLGVVDGSEVVISKSLKSFDKPT